MQSFILPLLQIADYVVFLCRGHVHPQPAHKYVKRKSGHNNLWTALLLPFRPVISAYGGLAGMLERLRVGLVYIIPEINNDVTMALARVFPGERLQGLIPSQGLLKSSLGTIDKAIERL